MTVLRPTYLLFATETSLKSWMSASYNTLAISTPNHITHILKYEMLEVCLNDYYFQLYSLTCAVGGKMRTCPLQSYLNGTVVNNER